MSRSIKAYKTDHLKEIMRHPSFHGDLTGFKAEEKLQEHDVNCYLTRYSESRKKYSLSVARNGKYAHFDLIISEFDEYEIDGTGMQSKDIFALLAYYYEAPLSPSVDGIGPPLSKNYHDPFPEVKIPDRQELLTKVYRKKIVVVSQSAACYILILPSSCHCH